jgi:hypothetical protein
VKFTDELFRHVAPHVVLSDLLGVEVRPQGESSVRCINAGAHTNGDAAPSASANGAAGLYHCFACGLKGDVVDLVRQIEALPSTAEAIAWLRQRYGVQGDVAGVDRGPKATATPRDAAKPPRPDEPFPPFPEAVKSAGWSVGEFRGRPAIRAPIYDAKMEPCGVKVRGPRGADGKIIAVLEPTPEGRQEPGLLHAAQLETAEPGTLVLVVNGETSLLAVLDAAQREGILVQVVCPSNGESQSLAEAAEAFRGLRVAILFDADEAGRKGGSARENEARVFAAATADVELPFTADQRALGCKDVRDWLTKCGRSLRELVGLVERAFPRARTGTQLLEDLRTGRLARRPELVDGVLRMSDICWIFGPAGMGKSQLGLALAVCLALGSTVAPYVIGAAPNTGWRVALERPVRVLLFSAEDEEADTATRLREFLRARGIPEQIENLLVVTPRDVERNLNSGEGQRFLERQIREFRAEVVLIDNLTTVVPGLQKSEESEATAWINGVLRRLRDRYGVTIVVYGHANKGGGKDEGREALDRLFGSVVWGACADGAVMIDYVPGKPGLRRLIHAKHRGFAQFSTLTLEAARGDCVFPIVGVESDDAPPGRKLKVSRDEIVDALHEAAKRNEHEMPRDELHAQVNVNRTSRGNPDRVGRTALESAILEHAKRPNAGFKYRKGTGHGNPWMIWLDPRPDLFGEAGS